MPKKTQVPKIKIRKFNPEILEKRRIAGSPPTIVVIGKRGCGKCVGLGTPVIMHDGSVKEVQEIVIGDQLMGDDSGPRTVLNLSQGRSPMYKIKQNKADDYTVNENHLLSLKVVKTNTVGKPINLQGRKLFKDNIIDIPIKDYMKLSKTTRTANLKGYRVSVDFPEKEVYIDPYLLGLWLGDGTSASVGFTNKDSAILKYLSTELPKYDCYLKRKESTDYGYHFHTTKKRVKGLHVNNILNYLKDLDLINNKHIPQIYKTGSREQRLKLLAGLIDTDGTLDKKTKSTYDIVQKNYKLAKDIEFVARSLGFSGTIKKCKKSCQTGNVGTYYRMCISGEGIDEIPCLIPRKQANPYGHNKFSLCTGIEIEEMGEDDYYGFEVDGNHRFLLGDFTVTHNSTLVSDLLWYLRSMPYFITMSGTEEGNGFYSKYNHKLLVHGEYKENIVSGMLRQQRDKLKKAEKAGISTKRPDMGVGLLLDDCGYNKKIMNGPDMRTIFMNGRHWNILFIVSLQYMMGIPPDLRTNIDYVFCLRENIRANQKRLYDNFFGIFPKFAQFQEAFTECTENYSCMVLDNTAKSTKVTDCVFWYKAVPDRVYRIGSTSLWKYLDGRYDPDHDEKETEGIQPERNSGISVQRLPMVKIVDAPPNGSNNNSSYPGNSGGYPTRTDHRDDYHRRR